MNQNICPKCSHQNEATMNFCLDCGTSLFNIDEVLTVISHQEPPTVLISERPTAQMFLETTPLQEKKSSKGLLLFGGVAFLIVLLVGGVVASRYYFFLRTAKVTAFTLGHKLKGLYTMGGGSETYLFKTDGSFQHAGDRSKGKTPPEAGTYQIDGNTLVLTNGADNFSENITALNGDANQPSPPELWIDNDFYELIINKGLPITTSKIHPVATEFDNFAPMRIGKYRGADSFAFSNSENDAFLIASHYNYDSKEDKISLEIIKYASAEQAQAVVAKRKSKAVPSAEYNKKLKLPKCNQNIDYTTPEELVKSIPYQNGEILIIHPPTRWDLDCTTNNSNYEVALWTDGVYTFQIEFLRPDIHSSAFGRAEAFLKYYLIAINQ